MTTRVPHTGDEKAILHATLDRHRDAVLWKLEGLDDEQLRRPMTPTSSPSTAAPGRRATR